MNSSIFSYYILQYYPQVHLLQAMNVFLSNMKIIIGIGHMKHVIIGIGRKNPYRASLAQATHRLTSQHQFPPDSHPLPLPPPSPPPWGPVILNPGVPCEGRGLQAGSVWGTVVGVDPQQVIQHAPVQVKDGAHHQNMHDLVAVAPVVKEARAEALRDAGDVDDPAQYSQGVHHEEVA